MEKLKKSTTATKRPLLSKTGARSKTAKSQLFDEVSGLKALYSVQFITAKGKRLAILDVDEWEALVEWLESLEDAQIAQQALVELKVVGGDRKRAGWLEWNVAKRELD